jgi:hypothetical protein
MKNYYLRFDRGLNVRGLTVQIITEPDEELVQTFYRTCSGDVDDIIKVLEDDSNTDSEFRIYERGDLGETTDLAVFRTMLLEEFLFFEL